MTRKFAFQSWTLSLYLGMAPIYWLPSVPLVIVETSKIALFVIGIGICFFRAMVKRRIHLPRGFWGPIGFYWLIFFSIPGFMRTDEISVVIAFVLDVVVCAVFLWCFFNLARQGTDMVLIFHRAVIIISLFALLTVLNKLARLPDWYAPSIFQNHSVILPLSITGFSSSRTNWSNGLALYVPIVTFLYMARPLKNSILQSTFYFVMIASIIGSQIVIGGRAGLLASFVTLISVLFMYSSKRRFIFIIAGSIVTAYFFSDESLLRHFRLFNISNLHDLNYVSAYRVEGIIIAGDAIREEIVFGHGINSIRYEDPAGNLLYIHNTWLKWMSEFGIIMPLFFLAMIGIILCRTVRTASRYMDTKNIDGMNLVIGMGFVVITGIIISLFEADVFLGSFNNIAIWWAAIGIILGSFCKIRYRS